MLFLAEADLEQQIISLATRTVVIGALALVILVVLAILINRHKQAKKLQKITNLPLFVMIASAMMIPTVVLFGGTIYLNVKSESGGPVHWHAGIEFWACGAEINLRDPQGFLSNKVGTATYHEHNDKYIHLEGVVVKKSYDASLGKFMDVTGGYITDTSIGIPLTDDQAKWFTSEAEDQIDGDGQRPENFSLATDNGSRVKPSAKGPVLELRNGDYCSNADNQAAELQVFKFTYDKSNDTYFQEKLEHPAEYVMRNESALAPPSDCVIVEFDAPKSRTDKLCQQYGIRDDKRCVEFGVHEYSPHLCNIRETRIGAL